MTKPGIPHRDLADTGSAVLDVGTLLVHLSKRGNRQLKDGDLAAAEKTFQDILELEQGNSYALVGMAQIAKRRGDLTLSTHFYEKCLQTAPYNSVAMLGLADCYRADRQLPKALALWEKHLELHGQDTAVLTRVADAYRRTHRLDKARQAYATVLSDDPSNVYALIGLGYLHYEQQDFAEALACWAKAHTLSRAHTDVRLLTNLGNCHRKLRHWNKGIAYFQNALTLEPGNFFALFGLADCHRGLHQPEQSLHFWNTILATDPNNKIVLTRAGDALRLLGRLDEASSRYSAALAVGFDRFAAMGLATVLKMSGQYQEALNHLHDIAHSDPDNPRIQQLIADCQQRLRHGTRAA